MIREEILSANTSDIVAFTIDETGIQESGLFSFRVEVFKNGIVYSTHSTSSLTQFQALMSAITYVGICLRGLARDMGVEFDLNGMDFDGFIPLSKPQRHIWGE